MRQLSDYGLHKIEGYEGYGRELPDGSCTAYQDKYHGELDDVTIGFGCTEGVEMGMIWTRAKADLAFRRELAKHEAAINRMVTVELSQNQFDAMVSLSYNVGIGAVERSSVLKRLNKGNVNGAAQAFYLYNRAGGGIVQGLVARRASEAALFMKPDGDTDPHTMPATVTASAEPVPRPIVATAAAAATVAAQTQLPAVPEVLTKSLENADAWKGIGDHIWTLSQSAVSHPVPSIIVGVSLAVVWLWPSRKGVQ